MSAERWIGKVEGETETNLLRCKPPGYKPELWIRKNEISLGKNLSQTGAESELNRSRVGAEKEPFLSYN